MRAHICTEELSEPQKVVADRLARDWSFYGLERELRSPLTQVALIPTPRGLRTIAFEPDELGLDGFYTLDGEPFPSLEAVAEALAT